MSEGAVFCAIFVSLYSTLSLQCPNAAESSIVIISAMRIIPIGNPVCKFTNYY